MSPLSPSAVSSLAASTLTSLAARSIESDFDNFKDSFSSWDSCMSKAYCKWPVIAAIIVGGLIVLSLLLCISRCLCCGLECCFGCFACCNACCPSPRGRSKTKYVEAPQQQQAWPAQPYGWQPNMAYGPPGGMPATATFDAPSQRALMVGNSDALPAMPSWQTAQSRRIEEEVAANAEEERRMRDDDPVLALGEDSPDAIPMGAVSTNSSASAGAARQPIVRFASPAAQQDEARVPMLAAQQPQPLAQQYTQPQRQAPAYDYNNTSYGYGQDTSYAPARSPTYDATDSNPYDPPQRYPSQSQHQYPSSQQYQQTGVVDHAATSYNNNNNNTNDITNAYISSAPYPRDNDPHTSYISNISTAPSTIPPPYHSRANTMSPPHSHPLSPINTYVPPSVSAYSPPYASSQVGQASNPISPTYSTAGARYNANPYSWPEPAQEGMAAPVGRRPGQGQSAGWV